MSPLAPQRTRPLAFELSVVPGSGDRFGLRLAERGSPNGQPPLVIALDPTATAAVITSVLRALKESKLRPGQLDAKRKQPLKLHEPAGVRLALVMLGSAPLSRRTRIGELEEGVAAMSAEETYYWYSKCTGRDASRSRRALRLLLADE